MAAKITIGKFVTAIGPKGFHASDVWSCRMVAAKERGLHLNGARMSTDLNSRQVKGFI